MNEIMRYDDNDQPVSLDECVIVEISIKNQEWTNNEQCFHYVEDP